MRTERVNALVWTEGTEPEDVYPNGIAATVAEHLNESSTFTAKAVSLAEGDQGVSQDRLDWADVLLWWGHKRHDDVTDATVGRIETAVREDGLGFVSLHSAHYARPFTKLLGTSGDLGEARWKDPGEIELVSIISPDHPIADGVEEFALPNTEMFGEPFDVPEPDDIVMRSRFPQGGEFPSVVTFSVDGSRVVYVRPGHETFRIYHNPNIRHIVHNAAEWAAQ